MRLINNMILSYDTLPDVIWGEMFGRHRADPNAVILQLKKEELQESARQKEFDKKVMEKDWLDIRIKLSTEMAKLLFTHKIENSDWLHSDQEVAARSVDIADFMIEKLKKMNDETD